MAICRVTRSTEERSASPLGSGGVPRHRKIASAWFTASFKRRRENDRLLLQRALQQFFEVRLEEGTASVAQGVILASSLSTQTT